MYSVQQPMINVTAPLVPNMEEQIITQKMAKWLSIQLKDNAMREYKQNQVQNLKSETQKLKEVFNDLRTLKA